MDAMNTYPYILTINVRRHCPAEKKMIVTTTRIDIVQLNKDSGVFGWSLTVEQIPPLE